jgi:hypothetical protein
VAPRPADVELEEVQKAGAGKRRPAAKRAAAQRTTATKRSGAAAPRKPTGRATRTARKT